MQKRGMGRSEKDFLQLWGQFHEEQLEAVDFLKENSDNKAILWSSELTNPDIIEKYLNKSRFIIQTWVSHNSDLNTDLLNLGYDIIISTKNAWYLDHGFWGNTPYYNWKIVYENVIPRHEVSKIKKKK